MDKMALNLEQATDGSLMRLLKAGDQLAALELFSRYASRIRIFAQRKMSGAVGARLDAEDIVQSAFRCFFHAAKRGAYELPNGADLWGLLVVIALNRLRVQESYHRAAKRDVRITNTSHANGVVDLESVPQVDADTELKHLILDDVLQQLPEDYRTLIMMRLEGYGVNEISQHVGRSKRSVERMFQQARERLNSLLDREVDEHDQANDQLDH